MDPVFLAYSCFRRRKFDDCVKLCTQVLEKNPYDQVSATGVSEALAFILFAATAAADRVSIQKKTSLVPGTYFRIFIPFAGRLGFKNTSSDGTTLRG